MIVFFLVTAILNIALGYGLAIYLGYARRLPTGHVGDNLHVDSLTVDSRNVDSVKVDSLKVDSAELPPVVEAQAVAPKAGAPIAALLESEPASPTEPESPTEQAVPAEAEDAAQLESDVLAGIAEFRSQLAKMKAQPEAELKPAKAPALA